MRSYEILLALVCSVLDSCINIDLMFLEALKTITAELPQDSKLAPNACANLTPKLLNQIHNVSY